MSTQADIPSDLTDTDKAFIFQGLDAVLNSMILFALLYGMYTGILAVTLWNISTMASKLKLNGTVINKCWLIRRATVVITVLLHALITIGFAANWSYICSAFIDNRKSFWTVYSTPSGVAAPLEAGIAAFMCTILTDLYMIWCCWMVWGRRWLVVLPPILSLISATASKIIQIYHRYYINATSNVSFTLYISFILVTILWCTVLIIYRILTVAGVKRGAGGRLRVYHRFIEVLVESSALYSISLIVYLALTIREDFGMYYLDAIAAIAKGVAPTLLIGRAAAGHTCPKDDCDESEMSTIRFRTSSGLGTTNFQESTTESVVLETDIEAQQEQLDEPVVVVGETRVLKTNG
ncbi:hypothetical protein ARMSODRAFT_1086084 [Armillaria solidipes]|uniref:Uncharacterized protein n=1 Tax=Armillaria solidipes TaxID=1076256 RepID=A0A2H3BX00_9AGAR|nr:hypothetical protein ARMSODRAFT_1086084 [Armillaria solidipes]